MEGSRWQLLHAGQLIEHATDADRQAHRGKRREIPRDPLLLLRHAVRDEQDLRAAVPHPRDRHGVVLRLGGPGVHTSDDQAGRPATQLRRGALGDTGRGAKEEHRRPPLREMRDDRVDEKTSGDAW